MMAIFLQIVTWAQIWAAIAGQGYRLQPMSCYVENDDPVICTMPLHLSGDYRHGYLYIYVEQGVISIEELTACFGDCG